MKAEKKAENRKKDGERARGQPSAAPRKGQTTADLLKKAQEALRETEEHYRLLFENTSDSIYLVDHDLKITAVSPNAGKMLGYSSEELADKKITALEFLAPESLPEAITNIRRVLAGETVTSAEYKFIAKDGTVHYQEISGSPMIKDGKVVAAVGVARDITQRKRAEEMLEESERKYRTLVENSNEGIAVLQDDQLKFFNAKFQAMSGYEADEILSMPFLALVHPDDRDMIVSRQMRRLKGEIFENVYAFRYVTKSGEARWAELSTALIEWEGKPATLDFFTEITGRKKTEDELKLRAVLLDAVGDSVLLRDLEGRFLYFNETAHTARGYTRDEFCKLNAGDLDAGEHAGQINARTEAILREGELTFETKHLCKDGSVLEVELHSRKIVYDGSDCILTVVRDVMERKKAEENLKASNEALKKSLDDAINTMAMIVEIRDPYTSGHQRRVARLSAAIAREMGLDEALLARLQMAAIIHDIGKIYVPAEILSKPGKLGEIEFGIIKTHPSKGYEIVKSLNLPCEVAQAVAQHHERMDGSGYPEGLARDDIAIEARILMVSDVVEAMASHRPYRPALGIVKALDEIERNAGKLYDAAVVETCLRLFREKGFKFED